MNLKNEGINIEAIKFKLPIKKAEGMVYTTLKLSQTAHDALREVARVLRLKYAELFDSMLSLFDAFEGSNGPLQFEAGKGGIVTTRKTYVLKKDTLDKLRRVVKSKKINRDLFVEKMAVLFKLLVDKQISDKKKKYPHIRKDYISPFEVQANAIENKLREELGGDDPITRRFSYIVTVLINLKMAIEGNIEKGTPIDPEDISQQ